VLTGVILYQRAMHLDDLLAAAASAENRQRQVILGAVAPWLVVAARQAGCDLAGYRHSVDQYSVRHIRRSHGNDKTERARGHLAVTDADFCRIDAILTLPDQVIFGLRTKLGKQGIAYLRRFDDGITFYLEEVRTKRQELAAVSMRKYPATTSSNRILSALRLDARSDSGDNLIIINGPKKASMTRPILSAVPLV